MRALIVSAGELPTPGLLKDKIEESDLMIAVDGGLNAFLPLGTVPDIVVGDMDSVDKGTVQTYIERGSESVTVPVEKNETDSWLALEVAASRGASEVCMLGAMGKRVDHLLSNIMLLKHAWQIGVKMTIEDELQTMEIGCGQFDVFGDKGQTVSILPVDAFARVTAEGLYYPLEDLLLTNARPRGVSNVFVGSRATVKTQEPVLIVKIKE